MGINQTQTDKIDKQNSLNGHLKRTDQNKWSRMNGWIPHEGKKRGIPTCRRVSRRFYIKPNCVKVGRNSESCINLVLII